MPSASSAVGTTLRPAPSIAREPGVDALRLRAGPRREPGQSTRGHDARRAEREAAGQRETRRTGCGQQVHEAPGRLLLRRRRRPGSRGAARPPSRRAGTRRRSTGAAKVPCTPNLSSVSLIESARRPSRPWRRRRTRTPPPPRRRTTRRARATRRRTARPEGEPRPNGRGGDDVTRCEHAGADVAARREQRRRDNERTQRSPPRARAAADRCR